MSLCELMQLVSSIFKSKVRRVQSPHSGGEQHPDNVEHPSGQLAVEEGVGHVPRRILHPRGVMIPGLKSILEPELINSDSSRKSGIITSLLPLQFNFDFFNYAGIHRPVVLYTVPSFIHLTDVTLATDVTKDLDSATIYYQIEHTSSSSEIAEECRVEIQVRRNETVINFSPQTIIVFI